MRNDRTDSRTDRTESRSDSRSSESHGSRDKGSQGSQSGSRTDKGRQWRSFGERLNERLSASPAERLQGRLEQMRDTRQQMPLSEVKEARALIAGWKPDAVSSRTLERYDKANEYLKQTGKPPEQAAGTRGAFKVYRAAAVHQARTELKQALKDRDAAKREQRSAQSLSKNLDRNPDKIRTDLRAAESRIREARATLDKYPPGSGDPRSDKQRTSAYQGPEHSDRSNGKRDALDSRPADWRDRVWQEVNPRDRDAVAVAAITGARPAEIQKGVRVEHGKDGSLTFTIRGAKVDRENGRGQEVRTIVISKAEAAKSVEGRHLLDAVKEGKGREVRVGDAAAFSQRVSRAGERAGLDHVSAYDFRHAFASRLKDDDRLTPADRAAALGQQAERSQEAYGRAGSSGAGAGSISSASASSGTRAGR